MEHMLWCTMVLKLKHRESNALKGKDVVAVYREGMRVTKYHSYLNHSPHPTPLPKYSISFTKWLFHKPKPIVRPKFHNLVVKVQLPPPYRPSCDHGQEHWWNKWGLGVANNGSCIDWALSLFAKLGLKLGLLTVNKQLTYLACNNKNGEVFLWTKPSVTNPATKYFYLASKLF